MSKNVVLLFMLILTLSSLIIIRPVSSAIVKPSVPEFTLKYADYSYDVSPTYGIDSYTGKNVITQTGYHVENKSIEVRIENQPFTVYKDSNGSYVLLNYDIRWKGHFEDNWRVSSSNYYIVASSCTMVRSGGLDSLVYPNAPFTVLLYALGENQQSVYWIRNISDGGQVDFQVRALVGNYIRVYGTPVPPFGTPYHDIFTGETSDWSNTQTITISDNSDISSTPNPSDSLSENPTATPQQPGTQSGILFGLDWQQAVIILLSIMVVLLIVEIAFMCRRKIR
jgi:hypothetical protein